MTETTVGREPVQIVEIEQPLCALTYGVAPCTASGSAGDECFNTRSTCQDPTNYDGSSVLKLWFGKGNLAEFDISGAPYIIPSLKSVSTISTKLNLATTDPDSSGLGQRASITATFQDHPHSDRRVDPYLSTRSYDPLERGSFWTKWLARNLYRYNITINVYEGYADQALGSMQKRTYIITGVDGPGEDGTVTIRAKDFLSVVEERKAQVPIASPGQLKVDISATQTSLSLVGALTSDYDNPGLVRVEDEFMRVTSVATGAEDSVVLTVSRGALDSTATTHSAEEKVQNCFEWTGKDVTATVEELLTNHANIAAAKIDTAGTFATEAEYLAPGAVDIVLSTSTSVFEVLSNLQRQFGFYIWWDERDALVKLRVLRGLSEDDTTPVTLTDDNHFIAGTFKITDMPDRRVSQVWYHYDPRNDWEDGDKEALYKEILVYADLASEGEDQNGSQSILKILARFTASQAIALSTSSKIVVRYRDVPRKATFRLDAKDRSISVGDIVIISHYLDIDEQGNRNETRWLVTEMEEVKPGEEVRYAVDDVTSAGTVTVVMAAAAGDYNSSTSTQFETFIGDADGLLSDGTPCGRVSA